MTELIEVGMTSGVAASNRVSGAFNEVAVYLYHSCGFRDVAQHGKAVKMRLDLANKPEPAVHDPSTQHG